MSFQQDAVREWTWIVGRDCPDVEWLCSDYDTWEHNPHYRGPRTRHPEEYQYDEPELTIDEINMLFDEAAKDDRRNRYR